jgi:hypothetical protein
MKKDLYNEWIEIQENNKLVKKYIDSQELDKIPRCEDGKIYYYGDLYLKKDRRSIFIIPDNFIIYGSFMIMAKVNKLPKGLIVHGDFTCAKNQLKEIPYKLIVYGSLNLFNNKLKEIPSNIEIGDNLICENNNLYTLPENLNVGNDIYCGNNNFNILKTIQKHNVYVNEDYQTIQDRYMKLLKLKINNRND